VESWTTYVAVRIGCEVKDTRDPKNSKQRHDKNKPTSDDRNVQKIVVDSGELFVEREINSALEGYNTHSSVWDVAISEHQVLLGGLPRIEFFVGVFKLLVPSQEIPTRVFACVSTTASWVWGGHLRE